MGSIRAYVEVFYRKTSEKKDLGKTVGRGIALRIGYKISGYTEINKIVYFESKIVL